MPKRRSGSATSPALSPPVVVAVVGPLRAEIGLRKPIISDPVGFPQHLLNLAGAGLTRTRAGCKHASRVALVRFA